MEVINENERNWGKHIGDPCLYEKGNKRYQERDPEKNAWRAVKQFLIVFL